MTAPKWYLVLVASLLTVIVAVWLVRAGAVQYQEQREQRQLERACTTTTAIDFDCLELDH